MSAGVFEGRISAYRDVEVSLLSHRGNSEDGSVELELSATCAKTRRGRVPHIIDSAGSFVDDHEQTVLAVSLLEEGGDVSLSTAGKDLLFVIAVREDKCSSRLEALLEQVRDSFPYRLSVGILNCDDPSAH